MRITLIDYGAGNVTSVERALQRLGAASQRATTADCIDAATALLLPGVGHFGALIRALDERQLRRPILDAIERGVPFLGICLGLHALYASSDEASETEGLRILPQKIRELPHDVKLPHMGWNQLQTTNAARPSRLLAGIAPAAHFYFAHSYAARASDSYDDAVVATCSHGTTFVAVLEFRNVFAVQFHPEKSGAAGARVLQNFLGLAA